MFDETERKNEITKEVLELECTPVNFEDKHISPNDKISFSQLENLGVSFEPIVSAIKNFSNESGKSGLYYVKVPPNAHLAKFVDEDGFLGTALSDASSKITGQSSLHTVPFDPATLCIGIALMGIEQKLSKIEETQKDIIEFLELKEKTIQRGNLLFLQEIINNFKYNWDNEKYKASNHIKALDIRQTSEQEILLYRAQIDKTISKNSLIHLDKNVSDTVKKIQDYFTEYRLSLYLYTFSSYLEILLLGNFKADYIESIQDKTKSYSIQYKELYTECYNYLEDYSRSSMQTQFIKGVSSVTKIAGNVASKIPVVKKAPIDKALKSTGDNLSEANVQKISKTLEGIISNSNHDIKPFIDNIEAIKNLYNRPIGLVFDKDNIYIEGSQVG